MAFVLLNSSHPKFVAQAEVSSPKARLYRLEVTLLEARAIRKSTEVKFDNSAKVVIASESEAAVALNPNNGEEERKETQSGLGNGALIGNNLAPNCDKRLKIPGKKCDNISEDDQGDSAANLLLENTFPEIKKRVKRSVRSASTNNVDRTRSTSGEAQSKESFVETVQGVSNSRPEYRRTAEETKGSNPRQSSSDHLSLLGKKVILILTKLYDFNLGAVTESSLWRRGPVEQRGSG
ncbi:VPS10 domain-containing receptor SorCS3 [Liparis tanakae]|uniref:VPS10 domain-containing receptor SorCS3 n=1 Tax=Liparis tanakae TaxID=230148 RepID=A0A4Z2IWA2_9TELE|nr:VPS10 domain-containing receptor SorCS3 [Liparis tanakae]